MLLAVAGRSLNLAKTRHYVQQSPGEYRYVYVVHYIEIHLLILPCLVHSRFSACISYRCFRDAAIYSGSYFFVEQPVSMRSREHTKLRGIPLYAKAMISRHPAFLKHHECK